MNRRNTGVLLLAAALSLGLVAGCYVEVEDGPHAPVGTYLADLQVDWRVQGSQSATYCDAYDIEQWVVEIQGPESRRSVIDCRAHWSSENDFLALYEGNYQATVQAVDGLGYTIASQSTHIDLLDRGVVDTLTFEFLPQDFGF